MVHPEHNRILHRNEAEGDRESPVVREERAWEGLVGLVENLYCIKRMANGHIHDAGEKTSDELMDVHT